MDFTIVTAVTPDYENKLLLSVPTWKRKPQFKSKPMILFVNGFDNPRERFKDIWEEFEEGQTAEALFAKSLDRLMPLLHNFYSEGKAWKEHGIMQDQVLDKNKHIADGSKKLWELASSIINKSIEKGYLSQ